MVLKPTRIVSTRFRSNGHPHQWLRMWGTNIWAKDILWDLIISDLNSEPYQENHNFAEKCYANFKAATNWVLYQSGDSSSRWFLSLEYVGSVLNLLESTTLSWTPPLEALTGQSQDTLTLDFYKPEYYYPNYGGFSSKSKMR